MTSIKHTMRTGASVWMKAATLCFTLTTGTTEASPSSNAGEPKSPSMQMTSPSERFALEAELSSRMTEYVRSCCKNYEFPPPMAITARFDIASRLVEVELGAELGPHDEDQSYGDTP